MLKRKVLKIAAELAGVTVSTSVFSGVLSGKYNKLQCFTSRVSSLERLQFTLLSERIIPRNSGGAFDAGVPEFIDFIVSQWQTEQERASFTNGLLILNDYCLATFSKSLIGATEQQLDKVLTEFEDRAKANSDDSVKPIFLMLHELVMIGFYSSKFGATQLLKFKAPSYISTVYMN